MNPDGGSSNSSGTAEVGENNTPSRAKPCVRATNPRQDDARNRDFNGSRRVFDDYRAARVSRA